MRSIKLRHHLDNLVPILGDPEGNGGGGKKFYGVQFRLFPRPHSIPPGYPRTPRPQGSRDTQNGDPGEARFKQLRNATFWDPFLVINTKTKKMLPKYYTFDFN